jgi:AcrR family transcriptional regulator
MNGEAVHNDGNGQPVHLQTPTSPASSAPTRRADARRNRDKILSAARAAFEEGGETSMAAVARRAGVGMATLYRNFPGRRELLEAVYADEVAAVCEAARVAADEATTPGAAFRKWLWRFFTFVTTKRNVAAELLAHLDGSDAVFGEGRAAGLAAGRPLLLNAQRAGEVRDDITLEQVFDMVIAIATIHGSASYLEPILQTALDGLLGRRGDHSPMARPTER